MRAVWLIEFNKLLPARVPAQYHVTASRPCQSRVSPQRHLLLSATTTVCAHSDPSMRLFCDIGFSSGGVDNIYMQTEQYRPASGPAPFHPSPQRSPVFHG